MILRPDGIVLPDGEIVSDTEVCIEQGVIVEIRPWSSAYREESGLLLSPAFVNAHSHLEYRDLLGQIPDLEYWPWIREITKRKPSRQLSEVAKFALIAAKENRATGVTQIGETSDWPVSAQALVEADIGGVLFQEVITVAESDAPLAKLEVIEQKRAAQEKESGIPCFLSPHTPYTVSAEVIQAIAATGNKQSIHVAESPHETELFLRGTGPIAELYKMFHIAFDPPQCTPIEYLYRLGALHAKTQIVHACDIQGNDIDIIAETGATVAYCPRSNAALRCPSTPVRDLIKAGAIVGLGLDSAASAGPIDMFAEMREAMGRANLRGKEVWRLATSSAASSIFLERDWAIHPMANPDLLLLHPRGRSLEQIITESSPEDVVATFRLG